MYEREALAAQQADEAAGRLRRPQFIGKALDRLGECQTRGAGRSEAGCSSMT